MTNLNNKAMQNKLTSESKAVAERGPIVAIMGHIDHGKSTLLSYIRKSSEPLNEAGGITQHISAYEVTHTTSDGKIQTITFLDTPGHEAFSGIRKRGASVADVAVLVVSAEDGVKTQTIEALNSIKASKTPYIIAINKIDKPSANIEKTKQSLAEKEIYIEGYGGDIPVVELSAKTGQGVSELLDMIVLVAELESLTGDKSLNASGIVIESNRDIKKGISATCIIKNGTIKKGMYITSGMASSPVRIIENYLGKQIDFAFFPSPIKIIGWDILPEVGDAFQTWEKRDEARSAVEDRIIENQKNKKNVVLETPYCETTIPLIVKADTGSSLEAVLGEIKKLNKEKICPEVISFGIGNVGENDVRLASGGSRLAFIVGFNVSIDTPAKNLADRSSVEIKSFDIIYKISEWLDEVLINKTPKSKMVESLGTAKVIKIFSKNKDKQILGGKVEKGVLSLGAQVKIMRRDAEIGEGKVKELQSQKKSVSEVEEGKEFGTLIEAKIEIAPGDRIENFVIIEK